MQEINIGNVPNDGTGSKLRTAMEICNQNFTELTPNYKQYVGRIFYSESDVIINEPLSVGRIYRIDTLSPGDNFTNVGYDGISDYFNATGQYPISWNSSVLKLVSFENTISTDTFDDFQLIPYSYDVDVLFIVFSEVSFSELNTITNGNMSYSFNNDKILISNTSSIFEIKRYI